MWMLLADLHFDERSLDGLAPTLDWIHQEFNQLRPSHVFLLGDSTNQRKKPGTETTSALAAFIKGFLIAPWSCTVHCLIGNHDMTDLSDRRRNSMSAFCVEGVRVKEYNEILHTRVDGHAVLFIPFHQDVGEVSKYLAEEFQGRALTKRRAEAQVAN
jgi:predicted MPP superfamily phosphohydrolase